VRTEGNRAVAALAIALHHEQAAELCLCQHLRSRLAAISPLCVRHFFLAAPRADQRLQALVIGGK